MVRGDDRHRLDAVLQLRLTDRHFLEIRIDARWVEPELAAPKPRPFSGVDESAAGDKLVVIVEPGGDPMHRADKGARAPATIPARMRSDRVSVLLPSIAILFPLLKCLAWNCPSSRCRDRLPAGGEKDSWRRLLCQDAGQVPSPRLRRRAGQGEGQTVRSRTRFPASAGSPLVGALVGEIVEGLFGDADDMRLHELGAFTARPSSGCSGSIPLDDASRQNHWPAIFEKTAPKST